MVLLIAARLLRLEKVARLLVVVLLPSIIYIWICWNSTEKDHCQIKLSVCQIKMYHNKWGMRNNAKVHHAEYSGAHHVTQ